MGIVAPDMPFLLLDISSLFLSGFYCNAEFELTRSGLVKHCARSLHAIHHSNHNFLHLSTFSLPGRLAYGTPWGLYYITWAQARGLAHLSAANTLSTATETSLFTSTQSSGTARALYIIGVLLNPCTPGIWGYLTSGSPSALDPIGLFGCR